MNPDEYKATREKLGFTQAELAWRLGVPRETISRRENGIQCINEEMALALRALKPSKTKKAAPGRSNGDSPTPR